MTFEEWWEREDRVYLNEYSTFKMVAAQAWNHQQQRIDNLEATVKSHQIRPRGKSMLSYLPEGYVLVPIEPTDAMISFGVTGYLDPEAPTAEDHVKHIYTLMIQSAQESE